MVWTWNLTRNIFLEPMFGGSYNDDYTISNLPDRASLGCHAMFHTGASLGYRLTDRWSVMATWDHVSNAYACVRYDAINDYGVKFGYSF